MALTSCLLLPWDPAFLWLPVCVFFVKKLSFPETSYVFFCWAVCWDGAVCVSDWGRLLVTKCSDLVWIFSDLQWVLVSLIFAILFSSQSPSHKSKRQQQELIAELRRRQVKDNRHVYEGKDGAIEDIITGKSYFLIVAHGDPTGLTLSGPFADFATAFVQGLQVLQLILSRHRITEKLHARVWSMFIVTCILPVKELQHSLWNKQKSISQYHVSVSQYHWNPEYHSPGLLLLMMSCCLRFVPMFHFLTHGHFYPSAYLWTGPMLY